MSPGAVTVEAMTTAYQPTLLQDGPGLHEVDFVVVDLETTGGSPHADRITEIGAVRVRGGEVLGELATLVDPGRSIPPTITVLTGITDAMVIGAPREEEVIPTFLEFARGAVLVAHNARFDIGFLRAACERLGAEWPRAQVVDTVALARRVVTRDEAPNHKLGSLARLFCATVTPDHRALTDARATVDVLHGLLGRLASLGVTHLADLASAADPVPQAVRRKASLADGLPAAPGVYQFLDESGRVLYVGTATNLRTRVRSYFTAAEKRRRMAEMVRIATRVHPIVVATALEAAVRELRLIAELTPPYNRRSRAPQREPWIRLTQEPFPRASIVRKVAREPGTAVLGPFRSRSAATAALEAIASGFALRTCTQRLPRIPAPGASACVLAELGRCHAPCIGGTDVAGYGALVGDFERFCAGETTPYLTRVSERLNALVAQERYEEAALERDRCQALLQGAARAQRLASLGADELLAARPLPAAPASQPGQGAGTLGSLASLGADAMAPGGQPGSDSAGLFGGAAAATGPAGPRPGRVWEVICVRHGRLAGSALAPSTASVLETAAALRLTSEHVEEPTEWAGSALAEETELIARWLESPGVRLLTVTGLGPALPRDGAQRVLADLPAHLMAAVGAAVTDGASDDPAPDGASAGEDAA